MNERNDETKRRNDEQTTRQRIERLHERNATIKRVRNERDDATRERDTLRRELLNIQRAHYRLIIEHANDVDDVNHELNELRTTIKTLTRERDDARNTLRECRDALNDA